MLDTGHSGSRSGAEHGQDDAFLDQSSQPPCSAVALHFSILVIQFPFERVCIPLDCITPRLRDPYLNYALYLLYLLPALLIALIL